MSDILKIGLKRHPVIITWVIVMGFLMISAAIGGYFGGVGTDSDDQMRLVQIRDLLAGQNWFDPMQYRLGMDAGTQMHWSRLVDLPIVLLIKGLDLFLPYTLAEGLAVTFWPPLTTGLVLAGLALGARGIEAKNHNKDLEKSKDQGKSKVQDNSGQKILLFTLIMSGAYLSQHFRFMPGAIDHHNLQLGALAFAMGALIWSPDHGRYYALAGVACMGSLAIGMEANIFVAIICVYVAGLWAVLGEVAKRGAQAFGVALAVSSVCVLITTISPNEYFKIACDAFSGLVVLAALLGGLGLAALAAVASNRLMLHRLIGLCGIGIICGGVLLMAAPQCLSNPLDALSPQMKTYWLDQITEARPLVKDGATLWQEVIFFLCVPLLALGLCIKSLLDHKAVAQNILFIVLILSAFAMTVYQVRFYIFLHIFALLPASIWVAHIYVSGKGKNPGSVTYLFALIVASPMAYFVLGSQFMPTNNVVANTQAPLSTSDVTSGLAIEPVDLDTCYTPDVLDVYKDHKAARILGGSNAAPLIFLSTDDTAVFGNYHRNLDGISAALEILLSDKDVTKSLLVKHKIDYLHYCAQDGAITNFRNFAPNGLIAQIYDGVIPDYLERVPLAQKGTGAQIYKITPNAVK